MQDFYSVSTIYVTKTPPLANGQTGRGKYVSSIEEAARVVCDLRRSGVLQPISVKLEKGEYELAQTLEFQENFFGVTFESASGNADDVCISGGEKLNGFKPCVFNGVNCVVAYLPPLKDGNYDFTDLYVNGERASLSRFPETGYLPFIEAENMGVFLDDNSKWVRLDPNDVSALSKADIEGATLSYLHYWIDEHTGVESYDEKTGKLVMQTHSRFNIFGEKTSGVYYFENVKKTFGKQGEWYLDKAENAVYYVLRDGETAETLEARFPRLSHIANLIGKAGNPIKNVSFKNLTFAYTKGDYDSVTDDGLPVGSDAQAVSNARGVLNFRYAQNCSVENCKFVNYGLHGVNVERGCSHIQISKTEFFDGGAGGIIMDGSDAFGNVEDRTHSNEITSCKIHSCGKRQMAACGILIKHSHDNKIVGNEIFDLFYSGVSVGWVWGYKDSVTHDNYIAYNHIHHLGKGVLSDMGGVYLLGAQPGTVVCNNHIHDITAREYGGWALYTDEGSAYITLENNLCYCCSDNCFHQHYGKMNVVKNNIFAFAEQELCRVTWGEMHLSTIFERNIFITRGELAYGLLAREHVENGTVATGSNLFWSVTDKETDVVCYLNKKRALAGAQSLGLEQGSVYADPKCKNLNDFDFTLDENSPAFALGFQAFEVPLK